jgi:membrane-associated phospholipid phosphatase
VKVSSRTLLLGVAACAGLFCLILVLAYMSTRARELDARALWGFMGLQSFDSYVVMRKLGHLGDASWVVLQAGVLAGVALLRGRPRLAFAVVALVGLASVSSQLLKALLEYPRMDGELAYASVAAQAFPSGHSTAAMAIAIAGVLVAPPRIRPVAAVAGCALALTVGFSVVSVGSHFPSDVAGGFLLAATWGLVTALALRWADARRPERAVPGRAATVVRRATDAVTTTGLTAAVLAGGVVLAVVALTIGVTRPGEVVEVARDHTSALLVAPALAALAMALLTGFTLGLRRRG